MKHRYSYDHQTVPYAERFQAMNQWGKDGWRCVNPEPARRYDGMVTLVFEYEWPRRASV